MVEGTWGAHGPATYRPRGFRAALRVQRRAFVAALRRDMHERLGIGGTRLLLGLMEPLLILAIGLFWHTLMQVGSPYGTSRALFLGTGLYADYLFIHVSSEFRIAARGSSALRRYPVETSVDSVLAASLMKVAIYLYAGIIGFGILYFYETPSALPCNWSAALLGLLAMVGLGFGTGLCNAAVEQVLPAWRYLWGGIARALVLFSGIFYVPDFLPVPIREALSWNPVLQAQELFRMGFYRQYPQLCYSPWYLWSVVIGLLLFACCADRVFRRAMDTA